MITRRENLLRVFRHERPEWIPIVGRMDAHNQPSREGMDPELSRRLGKVARCDESIVTFCRWLDLDIIDWFSPPVRSRRRRVEIEHRREGTDAITVWRAPSGGELRQRSRQASSDSPSYLVEHAVKEPRDLSLLAEIFADEEFELDAERVEGLSRRRRLVGDDGLVFSPMPGTPLGMTIRFHAGPATTAELSCEAPEALSECFAAMEENHLRRLRLVASLDDLDGVLGMDDTSTTTQSPAMFETHCLGYTDRAAAVVQASGKQYVHHSCGLIRNLLDLYRQTRMDAVHALMVPPVGDVTIREAKERLGPGVTMIPTLIQLWIMEDEEAQAASVREMFEGAAPGDNFIAQLTPDRSRTMAQTQRFLDECRKYQSIGG